MMNRRFFFGFGFAVWLLATVIFRAAGHLFFLDDNFAVLAVIWLAAFVGLLAVALFLFRWQKLQRAQRYEAAVLMVISGMVLDAFVTETFTAVFPNMPASSASSFGAWLLLAYAGVLMAALLPMPAANRQPSFRQRGSAGGGRETQAHK